MGEGSFAGTRGNDKVAPKAVTRSRQRERLNSTQVGPSQPIERSRKRTPEASQPVKVEHPGRANRRCPPDGYDVSWMRVSQSNERWRTWEGSTARLQR